MGWSLGKVQRATRRGTIFKRTDYIAPIVSDGNKADFNVSPNQAIVEYDLLLYVAPLELPTTDIGLLVANYIVRSPDGRFYDIAQAATGRNQANGTIEHMEFALKLTEAIEELEDGE